jgi:hypothetical protein
MGVYCRLYGSFAASGPGVAGDGRHFYPFTGAYVYSVSREMPDVRNLSGVKRNSIRVGPGQGFGSAQRF